MTGSTCWSIRRTLGATLLLAGATAVAGVAQGHPHGAMPQHHQMPDTAMMAGPHHLLAMAYRDNLANFARVLQAEVTRSKAVAVELARPAAAEMRRSFDQMRSHHEAQMAMPGPNRATMTGMTTDQMKARLAALDEQVAALGKAVGAGGPETAKVVEITAAILKHCEGMIK
ncbi:MAG TPA: hypothetical protein VI383_09860 [Gemmatimonadales bacterium]|nr:hypothetical protein [Gemmatimonadales bacterium]